ncbi:MULTISPECIES: hypothetical protein [unclassified Arthrobacter]|nr:MULTISPECIES: hypothetical protein [unclassified Arthrobacter]MCC3275283.1 hypothetical protein [Arthrobacter sp. zg-Y20]MCC3278358.1 hypothetical protein [Arthrobacter sp. zg-Y40]MCC9176729.1 hypothetical protein [Arthrobacter sp. zg-Y750]MDK1315440.1 hypothetical protein [Arthrobacter sp. zg.Y20]MDK1326565.1 hypothetical protein [Arthrobacter sp. zg-Y1143]
MKVTGIMRPIETRELEAEGENFLDAREALQKQVPEGWQLIMVTTHP